MCNCAMGVMVGMQAADAVKHYFFNLGQQAALKGRPPQKAPWWSVATCEMYQRGYDTVYKVAPAVRG